MVKLNGENYAEIIYKFIMDNPDSSDLNISEGTGIPINAVPAARAQLIKDRRIHSFKYKTNEKTGKSVRAWRIRNDVPKRNEVREPCPFCTGMNKPSANCTWCKGRGYTTKVIDNGQTNDQTKTT